MTCETETENDENGEKRKEKQQFYKTMTVVSRFFISAIRVKCGSLKKKKFVCTHNLHKHGLH